MFWSLVRPDKILLPITRSAAVATSLAADESAVGMITCEMFKGQTEVRPSDQRQAWALFSNLAFKTHQRPRLAPPGGGPKKRRCPSAGRGGGLVVLKMSICIVVEVPNAARALGIVAGQTGDSRRQQGPTRSEFGGNPFGTGRISWKTPAEAAGAPQGSRPQAVDRHRHAVPHRRWRRSGAGDDGGGGPGPHPGGAGRHPQARCLSCGPVWRREAEPGLFS